MSADLVQFLNQYNYEYVIKATGEKVFFKPITTGQIKALLIHEDSDDDSIIEIVMDELITGCVITEGFDVNRLTLQDRFDLLLEIRKKSKGEIYQFTTRCPACGEPNINNVDLDKLPVKPFPDPLDRKVKLSIDLTAEFHHVTRQIQKESQKAADEMKGTEGQKMMELTMLIYASCIKKFDTPAGEITDKTVAEKKVLLENLDNETFKGISEWFETNDFGTDFTYELSCSSCEHKDKHSIPVSDFFS